jgi:hypothetical protein
LSQRQGILCSFLLGSSSSFTSQNRGLRTSLGLLRSSLISRGEFLGWFLLATLFGLGSLLSLYLSLIFLKFLQTLLEPFRILLQVLGIRQSSADASVGSRGSNGLRGTRALEIGEHLTLSVCKTCQIIVSEGVSVSRT